ncbi:MAG: DUF86 domain-containing protein [Methanofastidiosum sp.]
MNSIEKFVSDMTYNELISDDKTVSAVIRKFEIIGEASKIVSQDIKDRYPEIPWKNMAGMRDTLIHAYFGIDYKLVWDSIKIQIPEVRLLLEKILEEL